MSWVGLARGDAKLVGRWIFWVPALLLVAFSIWVIPGEWRRVFVPHGLWDFGAFVASARAAAAGLDPYGIYPPLTPHVVFAGFEAWNPNLNPPISALLFQLFDVAPPEVSLRVWNAVSAFCYLVAIGLLAWRYARGPAGIVVGIWALALAGFWDTLYLGQIYTPLVLWTVGAWLLLERGHAMWAGVLIGLVVAMKPNFLVCPVLLLLAGYPRAGLVSLATFAVIGMVPVFVFGADIYRQWLALVVGDGDRAMFLTNASLSGFTARMGLSALGTPLSALFLAGLALWAFFGRPSLMRVSALALFGAVFASPLGWIHYTLFLLPVMLAYWRHWPMWIVAALLAVPVPVILGFFGAPVAMQLTLGSAYGWALVVCLVVLVTAGEPEPLSERS